MNKKKFPKKIYLLNNENLEDLSQGTDWCEDSIYSDDVLYLRADEIHKLKGLIGLLSLKYCKNKSYVKSVLNVAKQRYKELMKND